jgi:hypothetical protein
MGTLTKTNTFTSGTPAVASEVNVNFDEIINEINGNIDAINLGTAAVTNTKIGTSAVSTVKIADLAVTAPKLAAAVQADIDARVLLDGSNSMTGNLDISKTNPGVELYHTGTVDLNYRMRINGDDLQLQQITDAGTGFNTILQYDESATSMETEVRGTLGTLVTETSLVDNVGPMYVFKINCDATTPTLVNGPSGWTISRNAAGEYTIDCGTDLGHTNYTVQLTPYDGIQAGFWIVDINLGEFDILVIDTSLISTDGIDFSCHIIDYS